ncbi:MAG: SMC-Scp complex subunit ScpB [Sphaerochaetaceae bacterium]
MEKNTQSGPLLSQNARIVEVILFLENEPVDKEKLARMTGLTSLELRGAVDELAEHYNLFMHGLMVNENTVGFQLVPCSDLFDKLKSSYGKKVERRLSKAATETLSIVAYSQPVTRREIDNIRGVTSDTIVKLLREREYIKVVGRKDVPGHPCLYGTTRKFLYEFNISSISALPKLSEIDQERFENTVEEKTEEVENET